MLPTKRNSALVRMSSRHGGPGSETEYRNLPPTTSRRLNSRSVPAGSKASQSPHQSSHDSPSASEASVRSYFQANANANANEKDKAQEKVKLPNYQQMLDNAPALREDIRYHVTRPAWWRSIGYTADAADLHRILFPAYMFDDESCLDAECEALWPLVNVLVRFISPLPSPPLTSRAPNPNPTLIYPRVYPPKYH